MNNLKKKILKILKEYKCESIDDLKKQSFSKISKFLKNINLSYFEAFFETEIEDIREQIEKDKIKIIKIKYGTKEPQDNSYYDKKLTFKEILSHNGNFGICPGYNHENHGVSLACIDIDGIKKKHLTNQVRGFLSDDHVQVIENLPAETLQDIKDYLLVCLLSILPNAMVVQTQSGGYHIFIWNKNHLKPELSDKVHYISQRLKFPNDCPIEEIRGLSLINSLEIFTTFRSNPIVVAGSFIKDSGSGETYFYKLMDVSENTKTFSELAIVDDINDTVKEGLINLGFEWNENPFQETEDEFKSTPPKKTKARILNPSGILKPLTEGEIEEIVEILLPIFHNKNLEGVGHYTVLAFGGYFCHTITEESAVQIITRLLKQSDYNERDIKAGIRTIKENYERKGIKTGLNTAFVNIQQQLGLTNDERETLKSQLQNICYPTTDKTNKTEQDLEILIRQSLCKNKEPSLKILADYINKQDSFFRDFETGKKYKLTDKGFKEVQVQDIILFFNDKFGENQISIKKCEQIMSYFTNQIGTNYDLIIFANGTLNTKTGKFKKNYFPLDCLPKIKTDLNYIENAETLFIKTDLYNEFKEILESERWDWNEDLYYKCVGVSTMAINESDCFFIIVGVPNARKTTLLTPLKRFFTYSEVKIQTIAKNERFQLLPCLRKDINIDDDLSDTIIKDSGYLKTFISGAGGTIEMKGENIFPELTAETTPIIWGASNKLPTIHGEGIERRTCLLLAENPIDTANAKKNYQTKILNGERDNEIELMISYSIQQYMKERDKPFLTESQQLKILKEWDWKSYPAKMGVCLVFMDTDQYLEYLEELKNEGKVKNITYDERSQTISYEVPYDNGRIWEPVKKETWTSVNRVNKEFKKFYKLSLQNGKIFQELSKPSTKLISQAMSNAGFFKSKKNLFKNKDEKEQIRIYEDCIINPDWKEHLKK